jgi:hypothetical protein
MISSNANPPSNVNRTRFSSVLASLVVVFFVFNATTAWIFSGGGYEDWLEAIFVGALVFQPIAFGVWSALAGSSILINLSLAVPCLMLLIVATGLDRDGYTDVQRREFGHFAMTALAIFAVALILSLAMRRFARLQIVSDADPLQVAAPRLRFSIKYLLVLTTLYAVVLAIVTQLNFQTEPPPPNWIFGPDFYLRILLVGGTAFSIAVIPTFAVPLLVLNGHISGRVVRAVAIFWFIVTLLLTGIWGAFEDAWPDILVFLLLVQLGAVIAGAPSAIVLRANGYRLVRREHPVHSP